MPGITPPQSSKVDPFLSKYGLFSAIFLVSFSFNLLGQENVFALLDCPVSQVDMFSPCKTQIIPRRQSLHGFFQPWNGMVACDQPKRKVAVTFKARQITVLVNGEVYLRRATHKEIVPDESTWHIDSEAGILEVCVFYVAMDIFCMEESGRVGRSAMGGCAKA